MSLSPNPGDRPSRLALSRYATGELSPDARREIEDWIRAHPEDRAWLDALDASRGDVPPLDHDDLVRRATRQEVSRHHGQAPPTPRASNRSWPRWWIPVVALAAVGLLVLRSTTPPAVDTPDPGIRIRGNVALNLYTGDPLVPYDGHPLGEGDVLGFRVHPDGHRSIVLLSVEDDGTTNVFFPDDGEVEPLPEGADVPLPGTVRLDDAHGAEVFVAVFDTPASLATEQVRRRFDVGGLDAVLAWAEEEDHVDATRIARR